jgi:glycosyltransferase involved in cell wall biosynthesis
MKVLMIHNTYQIPGGEQVTSNYEADNLRAHGHEVVTYHRTNAELADMGRLGKLAMPRRMTWAYDAVRDIHSLIKTHQPDIAHIHNTHFMISPAAIHACTDAGVPVVQTLHNFRLICPAATLFRNGRVCEECVGQIAPFPAVQHACFRGSHAQTAALAASTSFHRYRRTYDRVTRFITPTEFARKKLIAGGLNGERIIAKPHFLAQDPGYHPSVKRERFMLYVGRFTPEKGSLLLLDAWTRLTDIPLVIIGDGPLMKHARRHLNDYKHLQVKLTGRVSRDEVTDLMRRAYALVFPSECYETFGMVAVEAFAVGLPVIASGHGAPSEIIKHGETGLHFTPGDPDALAAAVDALWNDPHQADAMRANARTTFETHYTAERNYDLLMGIYRNAIGEGVHA